MVSASGTGSYGIHFTGSANGYVDNAIFAGELDHDVSGTGVELGENFCCSDTLANCDGYTWCPWLSE